MMTALAAKTTPTVTATAIPTAVAVSVQESLLLLCARVLVQDGCSLHTPLLRSVVSTVHSSPTLSRAPNTLMVGVLAVQSSRRETRAVMSVSEVPVI